MNSACPCQSGKSYADCCQPIIQGTQAAASAEALMRSRYTAYVRGEISHIINSCVQDDGIDEEATRQWSQSADWQGLDILATSGGGPEDQTGTVDFVAHYLNDGVQEDHHELARFVRQEGRWLYESGTVQGATVVREGPKVGRNDPCPCGSGKKYKQCCG